MMFLNPEMIWTGISIAFYTSMVTPIIVFQLEKDQYYIDQKLTGEQKEAKGLQCMIAFGVGEIFGGILMGKLFDYFGA